MSSEGDSSIPWVGMPLIASADVAAPYREDQIRPYHVFYYQDPYNIWQSPHVSTHAQLSRRLRRFDPTPNGRRTEKSKDDLQLPSLQDWYPSVNLSGRVFRARDTLIEVNLGNKDAMTVRTLRDNLISTSAVCPEQSSSRLMMWQDIRDNCILYPVTIYSLWAILATCSRSKLLEAISTWTIWNPVKTVVDHDVIRASICSDVRSGQKSPCPALALPCEALPEPCPSSGSTRLKAQVYFLKSPSPRLKPDKARPANSRMQQQENFGRLCSKTCQIYSRH